jgi:hypothetical protein
MMKDRPIWFAPKSHGYGTGLPIAWQGWVLFIGFLLIVILGGMFLAERSVLAYLSLVIPLTIAFVLIARNTTRGGWRWRWGDDD